MQAKGSKLIIAANIYDCMKYFQSDSIAEIKNQLQNMSASNLPKDDGSLDFKLFGLCRISKLALGYWHWPSGNSSCSSMQLIFGTVSVSWTLEDPDACAQHWDFQWFGSPLRIVIAESRLLEDGRLLLCPNGVHHRRENDEWIFRGSEDRPVLDCKNGWQPNFHRCCNRLAGLTGCVGLVLYYLCILDLYWVARQEWYDNNGKMQVGSQPSSPTA